MLLTALWAGLVLYIAIVLLILLARSLRRAAVAPLTEVLPLELAAAITPAAPPPEYQHIAGPYVNGVQRCLICDRALIDYRRTEQPIERKHLVDELRRQRLLRREADRIDERLERLADDLDGLADELEDRAEDLERGPAGPFPGGRGWREGAPVYERGNGMAVAPMGEKYQPCLRRER